MFFYGEHKFNLDEKGRVAIPSQFRQPENQVIDKWVITKGLEHSLILYPHERWKEVVGNLNQRLSYKNEKDRAFLRFFIFPARELVLDRQGRFVLPRNLQDWAGICKSVVYLGAIEKIEIWSEESWEGYVNSSSDQIESILNDMEDFKF